MLTPDPRGRASLYAHLEFDRGLDLRTDDVVLGRLPSINLWHDGVIMNWALRQGAAVVTMPRFDME